MCECADVQMCEFFKAIYLTGFARFNNPEFFISCKGNKLLFATLRLCANFKIRTFAHPHIRTLFIFLLRNAPG